MHTFSFFLLITPQQKRKSPVKSLATIGGALHSLLGFLFAVSSMQEEKDYSSSSSKWLFLNTSRNNSISSFELGFIIFTT